MATILTDIEVSERLGEWLCIEVDYSIAPGFAGSFYQPPEDATAEVLDVWVVVDGKKYPAPWLADMLAEDEEILSLCLLDAEDRAIDAAEYRAESLREEQMLEASA